MSLPKDEDVLKATSILKALPVDSLVREDRQLRISLKGLKPMQLPTKTRVLYADPKDLSAPLRPFCEAVRAAFEEARLLTDTRELKLHATIVNTLYAKHKPGNKDGSFNASLVLEEIKDFVWCEELRLDRLSIAEMGAEKIKNESGEVVDLRDKEIATIPLPG